MTNLDRLEPEQPDRSPAGDGDAGVTPVQRGQGDPSFVCRG